MVSNTLLTILILPMIFTSIYLLGRYISKSQEVFANNSYGSFMVGAVIYFFLTFVAFFPFLWLNIDALYFVIIFIIKEIILYIFLVLKWEGKIEKSSLISFFWIILSGVAIAIIYNYGISKIILYRNVTIDHRFEAFDRTRIVFQTFLKMEEDYSKDWFMTIIVSGIAFASVSTFIDEFTRNKTPWANVFAFFITLLLITFFSFGVTLYELLGVFVLIFMVILSIRLIKYSRRRYGVLYGISTIALYSTSKTILFTVLILSFVTMIIYTLLRKPVNSLFWVQLFAPIGIVGALSIYSFYPALSFVVFGFALFSYIFVLSVGRANFMKKVNTFFDNARFLLPILIFIIVMIVTVVLITTTNYKLYTFEGTNSYVYSSFTDTFAEKVSQIVIYYTLFAIGLGLVVYRLYKKKKLRDNILIITIALLTLVFIYNPISGTIFNTPDLVGVFIYIKLLVFVPVIMITPSLLKQNKKLAIQ